MFSRMTTSGARLLTAPFYAIRNFSANYLIDTRGNTPFHRALHENKIKNLDDYYAFRQDYPDHAIEDMLKRVNNEGFLPIDCVDPRESAEALRLARSMLYYMSTDSETSAPKILLQETDVLGHFGDHRNPTLNAHLKLGVSLVNAVRQRILIIPNHPKQSLAIPNLAEMPETVYQMRESLSGKQFENYSAYIFETARLAERLRMGYCDEMSASVLYALAQRPVGETNADGEIGAIANGDHTFVVLGRKLSSVSHLPATWGDAAVIACAWMPAVYPASVIFQEMRDYRAIRMPAGLGEMALQEDDVTPKLTYLNPQFHRIAIESKTSIAAGALHQVGLFNRAKLLMTSEENYLRFRFSKP